MFDECLEKTKTPKVPRKSINHSLHHLAKIKKIKNPIDPEHTTNPDDTVAWQLPELPLAI